MAYVLKPVLQSTLNWVLKEFFEEHKVLQDFEWSTKNDKGHKIPLPETEMDSLETAINDLDPDTRFKVDQTLRDITELANEESILCLIEQSVSPLHKIKLADEFNKDKIEGYSDRAMWTWIKHRDLFDFVLRYQNLIQTKGAKEYVLKSSLPCKTDSETLEKFETDIRKHYEGKGGGSGCVVEYYHKKIPKRHCFHIFQEDCIKGVLKLSKSKKRELYRDPQQPMFQNVIFYEPGTRTLRIHARGIKNCQALALLFFKHCFGLKETPNYNTEVYNLSPIKVSGFDFPDDGRIDSVYVKEVICDLGNNEQVTLRMMKRGDCGLDHHEKLLALAESWGMGIDAINILRLKISVVFTKEEGKPKKRRTRFIGVPNDTNLSDDYYDEIIREHVSKNWEFRHKLLEDKKTDEAK
jgi:hypothetical protein